METGLKAGFPLQLNQSTKAVLKYQLSVLVKTTSMFLEQKTGLLFQPTVWMVHFSFQKLQAPDESVLKSWNLP